MRIEKSKDRAKVARPPHSLRQRKDLMEELVVGGQLRRIVSYFGAIETDHA